MEHIFLVDPIGKLPEKPVCLKRLSSLTGWDFSTGLFRSIHILLGFPSSSRPFTIYFLFFSDLTGNGKRVLRTGFSNRNFCVPFAQFETRWVFDVNGKQPRCIKKCPEYKITSKLDICKITVTNSNQRLI